jgi:hypothetical protein
MSNVPLAPDLSTIDFQKQTVTLVTITPAIAEQYLVASTPNIKMSNKSFERLVTDLRAGNFKYTGDSVKLSTAGLVIDGLARLSAIIKANVAVTLLLATGIDVGSRHVIDTGSVFTLKDTLTLEEVKHPGNVAAALTSIQAWERGDHLADPDPFRGTTTNLTSLAFLAAHTEVERVALEAAKLSKKVATLTTKQLSAFIWAFDKLSRDARTDFFAKLVSGANTGENDPIYRLREKLIANEIAQQKLSDRMVSALTIKAWNAYRANITINQLVFVGGGTQPEDFPTPK